VKKALTIQVSARLPFWGNARNQIEVQEKLIHDSGSSSKAV
jgi:hypothetical protein